MSMIVKDLLKLPSLKKCLEVDVMKNYRVRVETYDGCVTIWHEKSKAKTADKLILNRVYNQLCGLNIKEISVTPSV